MQKRKSKDRSRVIGVRVDPICKTEACSLVEQLIISKKPAYICFPGAHALARANLNSYFFRVIEEADFVFPDGIASAWSLQLQGYSDVCKIDGPSFMRQFCEYSCDRKYKHFFCGSTNEVLEKLVYNIRNIVPGIQVVGTYSPPFRPLTEEENKQIEDLIRNSKPDILWVGLGTPKQEVWMFEHRSRLGEIVMLGVGAAFDINAGITKVLPQRISKMGLDWLYLILQRPLRRSLDHFLFCMFFFALYVFHLVKILLWKAKKSISV